MRVGILKEIKVAEKRVSMTPAGVVEMTWHGHEVLVEKDAGSGAGFEDVEYLKAGAAIVETAKEVFELADMVMHVKEPQPSEYDLIREGQIVFTYLHLAADEAQTRALIKSNCIAIAYETIARDNGSLPLLIPMSEVAGRMATQEAARFLEMPQGGRGVLLGGVTGVEPGTVVIIGGGVVGVNAAKMACGLGAKVYILDKSLERLAYLDDIMPANCYPIMSDESTLRALVKEADVVIAAVLVTGAKAPKLITREMLKTMKKGSVIVDVAIDQGGCFETSRPTTHQEPCFEEEGVLHYCVSNMPGAVARTSTRALTNATLPYALEIADKGWKQAMQENREIRRGANIIKGEVTYLAVAEAFALPYAPVDDFLKE